MLDEMPRERVAELVGAAAYGSVLVLAALTVVGISDVALGHGAEIVAGVGLATWFAHLFAELLGGHIRHDEALHRREVERAAVDGSPILVATVIPAAVLGLARLDAVGDDLARVLAIAAAIAQLFAIGAFVASRTPVPRAERWTFALVTAGVGVAVVLLTLLLGH
jgi:hypothetical protein